MKDNFCYLFVLFVCLSSYRLFTIDLSQDVVIPEFIGGIISTTKTDAFAGDEVTLIVTPDEHYTLSSLSVLDENNNPITLTNNLFIMPQGDVTISATFTSN